jgi:hypothetical protein
MALRAAMKTKASDPIEQAPLAVDQRKQAEQRYRLQVDRQTKRSFDNLEAAAAAGTVIKRAHPIVQVSIYDAIDCVNQLIGPDGLVAAGADKPA